VEAGAVSLEITEPLVVMGKEAGRGEEISCGNWGIVLAKVSPVFPRTLAKIRPLAPLGVNTWRKIERGAVLFRNQSYTFPSGIPYWLEGMPYLETNYGAVQLTVEESGWLYIAVSGNPTHQAKTQLESAGFVEKEAFSSNGFGTGDPVYLMGREVSAGETVSYFRYGVPIGAGVLGPVDAVLNTNLAEIFPARGGASSTVPGGTSGTIVPDGKMFNNREYFFPSVLPEWITGVEYVQVRSSGLYFHVVKGGWFYIAAPVGSAANNTKVQLEGQGFTEIARFGPREFELEEAVSIMGKEVQAGECYFYSQWGIPIAKLSPDPGLPERDVNNKALEPPEILKYPTNAEYQDGNRLWQGCPSITRASNGRLWAAWNSGGITESEWNWQVLYTSNDDGATWTGPAVVIDPPYPVRVSDGRLWTDPTGRMWLFWDQSYFHHDARYGVWAMHTDNPESPNPTWSTPRRFAHGTATNKPIVLKDHTWLLTVWLFDPLTGGDIYNLGEKMHPHVYASTDNGETWSYRGAASNPFYGGFWTESMVVEQNDGRLRMLIRSESVGIEESYSSDKGYTWSGKAYTGYSPVSSRFFIGRNPATGNQILICNKPPSGTARSHMTVFLSEDDGVTWPYSMVIDERSGVSYPNAIFDATGNINVSYDRNRYSSMEMLMAKITEADIKAGAVSGGSFLQRIINNNQP
jgi:hypothetical protein